jgi:hypothetical protein
VFPSCGAVLSEAMMQDDVDKEGDGAAEGNGAVHWQTCGRAVMAASAVMASSSWRGRRIERRVKAGTLILPLIVGGKLFCFFAFIIEVAPLIAAVDFGGSIFNFRYAGSGMSRQSVILNCLVHQKRIWQGGILYPDCLFWLDDVIWWCYFVCVSLLGGPRKEKVGSFISSIDIDLGMTNCH